MTTGCISVFWNDLKQSMIFRGVRKIAKIDYCLTSLRQSVRPSVRRKLEKLRSRWKDSHKV
jgi:hypothetical protein